MSSEATGYGAIASVSCLAELAPAVLLRKTKQWGSIRPAHKAGLIEGDF